ncbi:hypothetical protein Pelo_11533 [Pelomyxa schiedti]|nr:hypothetical protein Pelo_11533 [Pelomyxa schiedti]
MDIQAPSLELGKTDSIMESAMSLLKLELKRSACETKTISIREILRNAIYSNVHHLSVDRFLGQRKIPFNV